LVAVVVVIIISRNSPGFGTRLASGAIGAIAAPWIFELPFDLIVMARTYPPIPPDPALYRALFFAPQLSDCARQEASAASPRWSPPTTRRWRGYCRT
jgi:hypothetical protein